MNIAVFSTRSYDQEFLDPAFAGSAHALTYFAPRLTAETAPLCISAGADALVAGTAVFRGGPSAYAGNIAALRGSAGSA